VDYLDHNRVYSLCHVYLGNSPNQELIKELAELIVIARQEERDRLQPLQAVLERLLAEVTAAALSFRNAHDQAD
jgi:hypothetical protein